MARKSMIVKQKLDPKFSTRKYNRCRISLQNKYFKNILIKLGCIPNKSLILKHPILQKAANRAAF